MSSVRGPVTTGAVGIVVLVVVLAAAVAIPRVALTMRTDGYTAEFANAAGMRPGGKVHVAGVPAGEVTGVEIAGDRVRVSFRLDNGQPLGESTSVSVKIATVMGSRYLSVEPSGPGELAPGSVIPLERTSVPYDLDELGREADRAVDELDLRGLREMMSTVQAATPDDPELIGDALAGVTSAAELVTRHQEQIDQLVRSSQEVSSVLVEQQDTLVKMLGDAELVLRTLQERRDTIRQLITDVDSLIADLDEFFAENSEKLGPLLSDLHSVSETLVRNEQALSETVELLAPASKGLANATGNGTWGDVSGPAGPLPDNLLCVVGLAEGCR